MSVGTIQQFYRMENNNPSFEQPANSSAKRRLFDSPNSEELRRKYDEIACKQLEEQKKKWGFDFAEDRPVDNSRYSWEAESTVSMPKFYHGDADTIAAKQAAGAVPTSSVPLTGDHYEGPVEEVEPEDPSNNNEEEDKAPLEAPSSSESKKKQTRITEFMDVRGRRKPVRLSSATSSSSASSSSSSETIGVAAKLRRLESTEERPCTAPCETGSGPADP